MPEEREVHSDIGASSSHRWIKCAGSVRLYAQIVRHETEYAATGTAAHAVCEACLLEDKEPESFLGQTIETKEHKIPITEAIVDAVRVYVDYVREQHDLNGGKLLVEQPFDLSWVHAGMFGRNDACIVPEGELGGTLRVFDYKNGRKLVPAENNPQLMYYALGALGQNNPWFVEQVEMTIVQPNAVGKKAIDTWTISVPDLYKWAEEVLRPAAVATEDPNAPFCIGEHCCWCEAQAVCPAKRDAALSLLDAPVCAGQVAVLPNVATIPPKQLGMLSAFFTSDEFQAWVKALAAEEQAELARGVDIPGRKLVESVSLGNRKWSSEEAVIEAFREYGEDIFNSKLKSPAQLSALLVKQGVSKSEAKERIDALVTREEITSVKVVNDDDPRPARGADILNLFE